ncbi:MAG: cystathionine gamma-synthase family protein [Deltaproteobacteria bacterium]|nr:MAG: cystathionine gamma-synthase family protein [Deltaproteobacteria bacterium]
MTSDHKRKSINGKPLRPESMMMRYGYDPHLSEGAIKPPIFQTSTFAFRTAEEGKAFFELAYGLRDREPGEKLGLIYSRLNNPDLEVLEDRMTLWDDGDDAAVFDSGMAAITTSLFTFVRPGDVLFYSEPVYGGTHHFIQHVLSEFGVTAIAIPSGVPLAGVEGALRKEVGGRRVAAALIETPANPTNALVDIEAVSTFVHSFATDDHCPCVMIDNTFLGPLWQHPLKHGADLVLYSATKFIGGHSDVIAGIAVGGAECMAQIKGMRTFLGTMAGPWTGWLLMRSLETLKMRMTAQMKNAQYVSDFLADHPKVEKVNYLGMIKQGDPMYEVYRKQCASPGSLISFVIRGEEKAAFEFLNALQLVHLAVSLGGTESLAEHPASMTHAGYDADYKTKLGIVPGLVRLSVGVEHFSDIIEDLTQAFDAIS